MTFWRGDYERYLIAVINYRLVGVPMDKVMDKMNEIRTMSDEEFDNYFLVNKWKAKFGIVTSFNHWRSWIQQQVTAWGWEKMFGSF